MMNSSKSNTIFSKTDNGFQIVEDHSGWKFEAVAEMALKLMACVFLFVGIMLAWQAIQERNTGTIAALGLAFLIGSGAIWRWANFGFAIMARVNGKTRQLEILSVNNAGKERQRSTFQLRNIQSCFLNRQGDATSTAKLCLRMRDHDRPVPLLGGAEQELTLFMQSFGEILQLPKDRIASRKMDIQHQMDKAA